MTPTDLPDLLPPEEDRAALAAALGVVLDRTRRQPNRRRDNRAAKRAARLLRGPQPWAQR